MDKRIILSVAGSGKTKSIVDSLSLDLRALIVTYTTTNRDNIEKRIRDKFKDDLLGVMPENFRVMTWHAFLYSFCYKPIVKADYEYKGLLFDNPAAVYDTSYATKDGYLYSNRVAKLIEDKGYIDEIVARINRFFDRFIIDEIQDIAGRDFNFLISLLVKDINFLGVGDFFQHTYDSSRDGNVNGNLYKNYDGYKKRFLNNGILLDTTTLIKSYRCSIDVTDFVRERLGISIDSHSINHGAIHTLESMPDIARIMEDGEIKKLFYQKSTSYDVNGMNWGDSKGDEFDAVCVVLNKNSFMQYRNDQLSELPATTKNKLYVALTRSKGAVYIVNEELCKFWRKGAAYNRIYKILRAKGIISNTEMNEFGVDRKEIGRLVKAGLLEKSGEKSYMLAGMLDDTYLIIQQKFPKAIFSLNTALYLQDLSDRSPLIYDVAVPANYSPTTLTSRNDISVSYESDKYYGVGQIIIESTAGNNIRVYSLERTLCDIVRRPGRTDADTVKQSFIRYAKLETKDVARLLQYAELLSVKEKIVSILEVLI